MDDQQLVRVMKALGDAKRFRMLQEIAAAGELSCGELAERFTLAQPTVSHHLKVLGQADLLRVRNDAQHHFVSLNWEILQQLGATLPIRLAPRPGAPVRRAPRTRTR